MKANELMIGDWVRVSDWVGVREPRKVSGLCDKLVKVGKCDTWFSQDKIEPIPLTWEILEKNGFHTDCLYGYFQEDKEHVLELFYVGSGVLEWTINCNEYTVMSFKYVHELQHVLRMCGIDKEIVL